jgi:hypothetical protein
MDIKDIINKYGVPDQSIVGKLPRGGVTLDFVGHAEITRILIEIDPLWNWEPVTWNLDGRPSINVVNGNAVMWGKLTVLGQTRLGVGTARHDKADLDKELIGDFLRNAAMRFGICLSLWSKTEWEDQPEGIRPAPKLDTDSAIKRFRDACTKEGLDAEKFANDSGVPFLQDATPEQIETLRTAFREYKSAALGSESAPKKAEESTKQQVSSFIDTVYAAFPTAETVSASPQIKDPTSQASKAQIGKIRAMLGGKGFNSYVDKLDKVKDLINKPDLKNIEHLSKGDANKVINMIEEMK